MGKNNPRRTHSTKRNALRARVAAMGLPCAICGGEIDYSLPPNLPDSYELDEIIPVSKGGNPYDPDNVQPTHRRCNRQKSDKVIVKAEAKMQVPHTRSW